MKTPDRRNRRARIRGLATSCVLVLLVAACAPAGLSRDRAIEAARHEFDFDQVLDATTGPIDRFEPGQEMYPGSHQVWAITVSGRFQGSCGPSPASGTTPRPCPPPATRATVIVDIATGQFIMASSTGGT